MTHGSLFAGIGGFDLGFERAGFEIVWQVEIDPFCRKVLDKHFPHAERYADIRECGAHNLKPVDVITGGFPCQDISEAGLGAGLAGERSGLWREYARIIGELRPKYAVVENVSALLFRGLGDVLGDLAEIGYDAEWEVISACSIGAPHTRERVFIVAYPASGRSRQRRRIKLTEDGYSERNIRLWPDKPEPVRVADGIPRRMDQLAGYGNAVVPQIPEWIARRIMVAEATDAH